MKLVEMEANRVGVKKQIKFFGTTKSFVVW